MGQSGTACSLAERVGATIPDDVKDENQGLSGLNLWCVNR